MSSNRDSRSVDLTTLVITAIASAAAAYTCSKLWAPGTLLSAAFTPVLVAVLKEVIKRPTEVVTRAVPVPGAVRGRSPRSDAPARAEQALDEEWTPVARSGAHARARGSSSSSSPRWRMAIITGLLGFVLCVAALTIPELVAGGSAAGGGRETTLFGGDSKHKSRESTAPTRTVTPPQQTVTAPPSTRTAPAPATTTPAPATTTPAPATPTPAQPAPAAP